MNDREQWSVCPEPDRVAGYARWDIFGGFDGRPLEAPDDQMIAWALKA